jgi:hypothetical protein
MLLAATYTALLSSYTAAWPSYTDSGGPLPGAPGCRCEAPNRPGSRLEVS